jgi:hypothetical protein
VTSQLENCCGLALMSCLCQKLVAEAGDSSDIRRKAERPPLQAATKYWQRNVNVDTNVRVIVNRKV